jgi:hypothetical protein
MMGPTNGLEAATAILARYVDIVTTHVGGLLMPVIEPDHMPVKKVLFAARLNPQVVEKLRELLGCSLFGLLRHV